MSPKKKSSSSGPDFTKVAGWSLLLVFLATGAYFYTRSAGKIVVPNFVGEPIGKAQETLSGLGLQVEIKHEKPAETKFSDDQVFKQVPSAYSQVPAGSVVVLYVAGDGQGIKVPELVGKTRSQAEDLISRLGLEIVTEDASSSEVEIGRVISQDPKPGPSSLKKGDKIKVVISSGRAKVHLPDLAGMSLEQAQAKLRQLGFLTEVSEIASKDFRQGEAVRVLRSNPKAGSKLPSGSVITLFVPVAAPPDPQASPSQSGSPDYPLGTAYAPKVEGMTIAQAEQAAQEAGLVLELSDSAAKDSVITFQEPPPGDPLKKGGSLLVRTRQAAVVPGLTGLSEEEARAALEEAGLSLGTVRKSYGPQAREVLGQQPKAGIEVVSGSVVDIVVADPAQSPDAALDHPPTPSPVLTPAPWVP